jgi:hypothetical protein
MADASPATAFSHWYHSFPNFQASPLEFYSSVEQAVKRREIPDSTPSRIEYQESGLLSARREYLRITRGGLVFDICAAPFGQGFFVSWWLARITPSPIIPTLIAGVVILFTWIGCLSVFGEIQGFLLFPLALAGFLFLVGAAMSQGEPDWVPYVLVIPVIGDLLGRWFQPYTYYRIDTALMFQESVRSAVLEVLDGMTQAKGVRALTETERKPILREFYQGGKAHAAQG